MAQGAALSKLDLSEVARGAAATAEESFAVAVTHDLAQVEATWRALTPSIDSPGQSFDFIRLWIAALQIPAADCFFITASHGGAPVALLPLWRRRDTGVRLLSWFPGAHVGCNAPIADRARLAALSPEQRRRLWVAMLRGVTGADLVHLRSVPRVEAGGVELFAELGQWIEAGTLYRAHFGSFAEADLTQRSKSRRKHDRQQGDKLAAMGTVSFEEIGNGPEARAVLDTLFAQRAARFTEMGVADPFAAPAIRAFYDATADAASRVAVRLHVLRLDGEIIATRYNVAHGDRLFCLISSMSEDPALRPGSPGKQCLLRVMQTVFDAGYRVFDMGEGLTDEKRHWCNEQIAVRHHYVPITRRGAIAAAVQRRWQLARAAIKSDARLLAAAKAVRAAMLRARGGPIAAPAQSGDD